jgi:hypothetical protein
MDSLNGLIITADGSQRWYKDNLLHREDGPAMEHSNGTKFWCINDRFHRTDGPAIEFAFGDKEWYIDGLRHREDGPAIESGVHKSWYFKGKRFNVSSQKEFLQHLRLLAFL